MASCEVARHPTTGGRVINETNEFFELENTFFQLIVFRSLFESFHITDMLFIWTSHLNSSFYLLDRCIQSTKIVNINDSRIISTKNLKGTRLRFGSSTLPIRRTRLKADHSHDIHYSTSVNVKYLVTAPSPFSRRIFALSTTFRYFYFYDHFSLLL